MCEPLLVTPERALLEQLTEAECLRFSVGGRIRLRQHSEVRRFSPGTGGQQCVVLMSFIAALQ